MINPLIHYELELATRYQEQLRHSDALWQLARQAATANGQPARSHLLRVGVTVVALVVGSAISATLAAHW